MARAYKKTYLNGAMRNLAVMMDCGVRKYGYTIGEFYQKFLSSCVSRQFSQGNPRYLVGMSGAELADLVVQESGGSISDKNDGTYTTGPEYWQVGCWHTTSGCHAVVLPSCSAKALEPIQS